MKSIDIGRERLLMAFWKYQRVKASNNNIMNLHLNENFKCVYMCLCVYVYLYVSMCVQNSDYRH